MSIIARENFNGQPISILKHNNNFYFHAVSIAKAMNYNDPKTAVRNFIERRFELVKDSAIFAEPLELGNLKISAIANLAINYVNATNVFLNAGALNIFAGYSEAKNSPYFKKWFAQFTHKYFNQETEALQLAVTGNNLAANDSLAIAESLNKQLSYVIDIVRKQEEQSKAQEERIINLELANRMQSIDRHQAYEIKRQISQLAYMITDIEGSDKPKRETFIKLWTRFNDNFSIPSYKDLPKERYMEALELLDNWRGRFNQELAAI